MQAFLLVSYSGLVWPTAADCALSGRLFRRRRPSHDPKAQSRHRRNDPSTYHIAVLTQFRRRPRQAPTGTGPLGTDTRLGAMIDGPRHRPWSYCPDTAAVYHPDRENSLPRFTVETVHARWFLAFITRYCFTSKLYCTIIFFANTPIIVQYIAQYYQLLHPPAKI